MYILCVREAHTQDIVSPFSATALFLGQSLFSQQRL